VLESFNWVVINNLIRFIFNYKHIYKWNRHFFKYNLNTFTYCTLFILILSILLSLIATDITYKATRLFIEDRNTSIYILFEACAVVVSDIINIINLHFLITIRLSPKNNTIINNWLSKRLIYYLSFILIFNTLRIL